MITQVKVASSIALNVIARMIIDDIVTYLFSFFLEKFSSCICLYEQEIEKGGRHMLYTLTTNPAVDMNICLDGLQKNMVNRTYRSVYTPNGKGLNVAFVLGHFHKPATILGFFGGFSGTYIVEESRRKGCLIQPIWIEGVTRINIFLNDKKDEYKLVNEGAYVNKKKQQEMIDMLRHLDDMDVLSICGSLSPGMDETFYDQVLQLCAKKKTKVVLDISSKKLADLLGYKPYLIKPNDEEIKEVFSIQMKSEDDVIDVLEMLYARGAQNILLTFGEHGSYFFNGMCMYGISAQPVHVVSSACAGDSALGAFLSVFLHNEQDIETALKRCAAAGANTAESYGIGDLHKVQAYEKNIIVRKVKEYA